MQSLARGLALLGLTVGLQTGDPQPTAPQDISVAALQDTSAAALQDISVAALQDISVAAVQEPSGAALQDLSGEVSGEAQCGDYQVSWDIVRSFDVKTPGSAALRATSSDRRVVIDLSRPLAVAESVIPLWCGDVVGDGSQVLGFETFSGGAHCCFSASLVLLEPGGRHVLDADLGNGGLTQPTRLEDGGPFVLPASSDVFAYFDDLSFAASPFMPLVFAYDGNQYVEATRQFPDRIRSDLDRADVALTEAVARPVPAGTPPRFAYQEQQSIALRLYGLHVLLGDGDQALASIQARVSPPVATWLQANADAANEALAQRYNLND